MRRVLFFTILVVLHFAAFAQTPKWDWVKGFGGNQQNYFESMITDYDGNIYVSGLFTSDTFYYGNTYFLKSNLYEDFILLKIAPNGSVIWARKSIGTSQYASGRTLQVDRDNNVYVAGDFLATSINFGGSTLLTSDPFGNFYDFFILKYDKNGNIIWARDYGEDNVEDQITEIKIDRWNNLYLAAKSPAANDTLTLGTIKFKLNGAKTYVAKIDSNGNGIWVKGIGNNYSDQINSLTLDNNGCIAVTGNLNLDNEPIGTYISPHAGHYLAKFDSLGNFLWAKIPDYQSNNRAFGLVKNDLQNNLIVAGSFSADTLVFGNDTLKLFPRVSSHYNPYDVFIVKYNPSGNVIWAKSYGGNDVDYFQGMQVHQNNIYVTGYFYHDTLVFGNDSLIHKFGSSNTFIAKLNGNGIPIWAKKGICKIGTDLVGSNINVSNDGSLYFSGYFIQQQFGSDTITLDTCSLISHTNGHQFDEIFLAKIKDSDGTFVNNISLQENLSALLYPNPFSNSATLKINSTQTLINAHLVVVDLLGREVQTVSNIHSNEIKLERNDLPNGIYFYHLTQNGIIICNGKMVVE